MIKTIAYLKTRQISKIDTESISEYLKKGALIWVDIDSPNAADYDILSEIFDFHPLAIEDCKSKFHLPKINDYKDYLFLVWHAIEDISPNHDTENKVKANELDVFIGANYLVTVHRKHINYIDEIQLKMLETPSIMKLGLDALLHDVLDHLVDEYFLTVDRISNQIDAIEDIIFENASKQQIKNLFALKHQLLFIRKIVAPERDIINVLSHSNSDIIGGQLHIYFLDIYDHLIRILDLVDTSRDVIGGAMDIYLSSVSNRLNEVMKKLTIVATIFMPLTLITGIYGMNFKHMPELDVPFFYYGALIFMVVFAIGMFAYFKWKKWW